MKDEDFAVQARLQSDIAWLNAAHEDNFYIAAAILPWHGYVAASQAVLKSAGHARPFDWQPLFYYAFGQYHFEKNPAAASETLYAAAPRARDQQDEWALRSLAAKWAERGYDIEAAAGIVDAMANTSPPGAFRKYLQRRAARLHGLSELRLAAKRYQDRFGRPPSHLQDLQTSGILPSLPKDPLGSGFMLDNSGQPVFKESL